jgi:hypothetical protein
MLKSVKILSVFVMLLFISIGEFSFSSCNGNSEGGIFEKAKDNLSDSLTLLNQKNDSLIAIQNAIQKVKSDSILKIDSIRISDSIKRTKNPIRDFN